MVQEMLFLGVMILVVAGVTLDSLGLPVHFKPLK